MKFTLVLDDSSGNSFIENPQAPQQDPHMTVVHYTRQPEQDAKLGIQPAAEEEENEDEGKGSKVKSSKVICLPMEHKLKDFNPLLPGSDL